MVNGSDMIEHIEGCEDCQKIQDEIDEIEKVNKDSPEIHKLVEKQMDCWNYSMTMGL